jgi:dipeptidyl aminopeptidase/acylaminoacyl peptidase
MFSTRLPRAVVLALLVIAPALVAQESQKYLLPPQNIIDVFDAEPPAQISVSPNKQQIALIKARAYPTIAELSQPMYRLAGARINPKTNGPHRASGLPGTGINSIVLKKIEGGAETTVTMPPQARISHVKFSPDGAHLAFLQTKDTGIELGSPTPRPARRRPSSPDRIASTPRRRSLRLAARQPSRWCASSCRPTAAPRPSSRRCRPGPTVHENSGKAAPAPTYEDLLKTSHDDALFDYYFASQLAAINTGSGAKATIGRPAIFNNVTPSPDGQYVLVSRVKKPFSHTMPKNGFAQDVEIWSRAGELAKKIADLPSREGTTLTGVEPGPRAYHWRADQPATILWIEALDGGDLKNKVPFRDRIVALASPFSGQAVEVAKTEWRYAGINYTDTGIALLNENDRTTRRTRTWLMEPGAAPRKVWDRKQDAAYEDPGNPVIRRDTGTAGRGGGGGGRGAAPSGPVMQHGDYIFVAGQGASAEGDRPFLDKVNLKTLKTERVFRSSSESLESFIAPLNDEMTRFITRYETQKDAPNYYTRDAGSEAKRAITQFKDPQPQIRNILRQYVTYKRKDGVTLSGTLYLPPGYKQGTKVPVIMWAYPREFGDADSASQVTGSPNQFTSIRGGLAHVPAALGLRDLRQPDDADHRARRDGERHLRRAADRERAGRGRQGRRDGRRRSRSHRRRRPQLRRVHDRQPAGALAPVPGGLRGKRRLQPVADAMGIPGGTPIVLGSAGHLHQDVAVLVCGPDQGSDSADARRGRRQHRHVPDSVRAPLCGTQGSRRHGALRHAAERGAWLRGPRDAAPRACRTPQLVRQVREERDAEDDDRRAAIVDSHEITKSRNHERQDRIFFVFSCFRGNVRCPQR